MMRHMVDDEKKHMLQELLKQMYDRMASGHDGMKEGSPMEEASESPEEEGLEQKMGLGDKVKSAEAEELDTEKEPGEEDDLHNEIGSFMKNKHKPKMGKGIGMMLKVSTSKPTMSMRPNMKKSKGA